MAFFLGIRLLQAEMRKTVKCLAVRDAFQAAKGSCYGSYVVADSAVGLADSGSCKAETVMIIVVGRCARRAAVRTG